MKRNFKRAFAVILTLVMILSSVPFSAYATENEATVEQGNDDISVSATNSLGDMITETLDNESLDTDGDYVITDLTFENQTATVSYMALENCNLVVAVYDENTMQMLTSEVMFVSADEVSETLIFSEALPEFFIAKAFLVDLDYAPLCKEYTSRRNTTEFVEFMALETTDFEDDKVINLDASDDNNFLVLSDNAQKIKGNAETNVLVSSDTETNTYVFENIDSNISSLKKGDIFHLDNGDMENLVVIKVASITIDGTTATIVAEASALEDVFETVKIDSDKMDYGVSTDSLGGGIVSEDGDFTTDDVEISNQNDPWTVHKHAEYNDELKNHKNDTVKIFGSFDFTVTAHVKIYIPKDLDWVEVSLIINPSVDINITIDGEITERRNEIPVEIRFSHWGVTIGFKPQFIFSASGNITFVGNWKTQIGFAYNTKDGFVNKCTNPTVDTQLDISGKFYFGFNFAPYLTYFHESVVDIIFTAEVGVTIDIKYSNDSGHSCDNCLDGDLSWSLKFDADIEILKGFTDPSQNLKFKTEKWTIGPKKIADFYYSFDYCEFGWGKCPYVDDSIVDSGKCGDDLTYKFYSDGTLIIRGVGPMYDYNYTTGRPWDNYQDEIKYISIADGVTSISRYAFYSCDKFTSIELPKSLTMIENYSFCTCDSLTSITIGNSVTTIGESAFFDCDSLIYVKIDNGVTTIEEDAFGSCSVLKSVIISDSVTFIGEHAFEDCHKLTDVYYSGSREQWLNIKFGGNHCFDSFDLTLHYNSTGPTTDSVSEFFVDSVGEMIEVADSLEKCFTYGGCVSGGSYTLVTVTENMETLALSNENVLYFDQVVANDCGMISTDFLPKTQVEGCVTLLIGDFGNGTEARVVTTTTYTAGDINLDTSFDGMDAIVVACVVNGMLTEEQVGTKKFEIADANLDGVIDTVDVTYLENKGLYLS